MRSARKSWSQVSFCCRKASKWCEEGQRAWHLALWERYLAVAIETEVSCQSRFLRVQTLVLMCWLWASSGVKKKQGMKEERFASCDLLAQAPLQGMPSRQASHLRMRVDQVGSQSLVLWCTLDLGFVRQRTCATLIKPINLAEASGNKEEKNCGRN